MQVCSGVCVCVWGGGGLHNVHCHGVKSDKTNNRCPEMLNCESVLQDLKDVRMRGGRKEG